MTLASFDHCITVTNITQLYVFLPIISPRFSYPSLHVCYVFHIYIIPQAVVISYTILHMFIRHKLSTLAKHSVAGNFSQHPV